MLVNEGLENAVWSGAIHYNTDNLHVHVAVVEPVPQRMVKEYTQYEYREDPKGKYVRIIMENLFMQIKALLSSAGGWTAGYKI